MASPLPIDPYEVLGVAKDASLSAIRTAHRKLVLQCHPDKIKDESQRSRGQDRFQEVQQAYELLKDDQKRTRYDQRVRLAELKREALERDGGIRASPYAGRPSVPPSNYEYREGRMYEERVPAGTKSFFDEDARFFDEPDRASARKHDGYERRHSGREVDDRKRSKIVDLERERERERERVRATKERAKESVRVGHSDRARTRDKERKREASDKYSRFHAYVESDESDSDDTYISRKPVDSRRRYEEPPRKPNVETPRRKETRRSKDDDYEDEWETKHYTARDYIQRSKGGPIEVDRRPQLARTSSSQYYDVKEIEPESVRRSSGGRSRGTGRESGRPPSSGKDRRPSIDIVEPPTRNYESRKIPSMPAATSAPGNIKIPVNPRSVPQPQRSSTMQSVRDNRREMPSIRRSETTPLTNVTSRRNDTMPSKSSKLKNSETYDSGYSSPGTPEYHSASPPKSTKYMIVDEDEDYSRGHRTVLIDPEASYRRTKSPRSPSPPPRRPERPTISTRGSPSTKPPSRSASYAYSPETSRPSMLRNDSSRSAQPTRTSPPLSRGNSGRDRLFGEVSPDEYSQRFSDDQVRYSPKIGREDINYGTYGSRRGSADTHRDAYPGSHYRESHRHPGLSRTESAY